MKLGIDLGNKTFTVMRVAHDGLDPVPNISTRTYGESQESYPAIFTYEDGQWLLTHEQGAGSITNIKAMSPEQWEQLGLTGEQGLTGILQAIREIIERNDPGNPIEDVVYSVPTMDDRLKEELTIAMKNAGWPVMDEQQILSDTTAALFGSGIYDDLEAMIGTNYTILVLDGKVHELSAIVYTVTVTQQADQSIHLDLFELNRKSLPSLGGEQVELMLAARAKQIAQQVGMLDVSQLTTLDWLNFVDYIKNQFLVDPMPFIAGDFYFEDGTSWEEPAELDSAAMYAVFRGESFEDFDGQMQSRQIEEELKKFIHTLCDEGGITAAQIQHIVLAGGTFRLPFWRNTVSNLFPAAIVADAPDNLSEVGLVGRGCGQYLQWKDSYQCTFSQRKRSNDYIGIAYKDEQELLKFKPLVALNQKKSYTSAFVLLRIDESFPLYIDIYKGPQSDDVAACEKVTTLRFLQSKLRDKLALNHVALRFTAQQNDEILYEIQHPYTRETIMKEALLSGIRAEES